MRIGNWTTVEAANIGGGGSLEPGGYVVKIVRIVDHPQDEYIDVVIDIAEGEHAGMYAGLPKSDDWRHSYRRYYSDKAEAFFAQFLEAIEISNRGKFNIAEWEREFMDENGNARPGWERPFIGLELGAIFQKVLFTKKSGPNAGKDGWRMNWFASIPAQDVRNGEFKVPADDDQRDAGAAKASTAAGGVYSDLDV